MDVEDGVPELQELGALEGLGEEIGEHVVGRTEHYLGLALSDDIGDEEVSDIDMAGLLTARGPTVDLELDGALVVLVDGSRSDAVSLGLDEVLGPDALRQNVADADELGMGRAVRIDLVLARRGMHA